MKRRNFLKNAAIGGAAFTSGSSIYFPKPATTYTVNRLLSLTRDGSVQKIYSNFLSAQVAREIGTTLPSDLPSGVITVVKSAQTELNGKGAPHPLRKEK